MITGKDFVFFGMQSWDTPIGSNCKNIAMEVARHNRVLYINRAADRYSLWRGDKSPEVVNRRRVMRGELPVMEQLSPNFWVYTPPVVLDSVNWVRPQALFDAWTKINNQRLGRSIQKAIQQVGFRDFYLFNDNDFLRGPHIQDVLKPAVTIYYIRDFLLAQDYFKRHGERTEPALMKQADVVVANSTYLANYARKYNRHSYFIGQGCDLSAFSPEAGYAIPDDIKPLRRPIIGYAGALLEFRLDIATIRHLAVSRPDSFDVCINPQALNLNTVGNYPRKVDEYLALGKPVVATATEAMELFAGHSYLCADKEAYVGQVERALAEDDADRQRARRAFALGHTWENNVAELYRAINVAIPEAVYAK
jgi:teichuronic acid biosynthesis glycosyltransferase TuaH